MLYAIDLVCLIRLRLLAATAKLHEIIILSSQYNREKMKNKIQKIYKNNLEVKHCSAQTCYCLITLVTKNIKNAPRAIVFKRV